MTEAKTPVALHTQTQKPALALAAVLLVALASLASACSDPAKPGKVVGLADSLFGSGDASTLDMVSLFEFPIGVEEVEAPLPGQFGAPCEDPAECNSGICVDSAEGKICSRSCGDGCPKGFACASHLSPGGDNLYECVPRFRHICDPCDASKDCNGEGETGNVCVSFGNKGSFCGAKCNSAKPDCPNGMICQQITDPASGATVDQCLPAEGECKCSLHAQTLALTTTCMNQNLNGKCTGVRQCSTGGLSECKAAVPKPEECNGVDDDCNGKTDDFDAANAKCTGKANEFGACKGVVKECVDGIAICDAPAAEPETCNQKDDNCDGTTDNVPECDDSDSCTKDTCDAAGCTHKPLSGIVCDDGSVCTQTDKCLAGVCTGGNTLKCDDNDPCTADTCDPFTGCEQTASSDAICTDDGNSCTQDLCQTGKCVHPQVNDGTACADDGVACTADICQNALCKHNPADGLVCVDDGLVCTQDVCKAGKCDHPFSTAACEDGNVCTQNDVCSAGKCIAGPKNLCNDNNPCTKDSCNPEAGCVHSNNDFASCTSGSSECPVGQCSGGSCFSAPNKTCQTKVKVDLCGSVPIAGVCTSDGKCTPTSTPQGYSCPGCKSACIKCFGLPVCLDFLFVP